MQITRQHLHDLRTALGIENVGFLAQESRKGAAIAAVTDAVVRRAGEIKRTLNISATAGKLVLHVS
jgi:hypothetical protein